MTLHFSACPVLKKCYIFLRDFFQNHTHRVGAFRPGQGGLGRYGIKGLIDDWLKTVSKAAEQSLTADDKALFGWNIRFAAVRGAVLFRSEVPVRGGSRGGRAAALIPVPCSLFFVTVSFYICIAHFDNLTNR